jgi:HEAT repeat protein
MSDSIKHTITRILYNDSKKVDLSESDIELLNLFPIDSVISILLNIYEHETDKYVRARAFRAILALHDFDKVAFLIDILDRAPVEWQYNACYELRYFQDARAVAKLCAVLLENSTPDLRYVAAESLADFDDLTAIQALEYARDHDTGEDYEGVPVSETAKWSLDKIRSRANRS